MHLNKKTVDALVSVAREGIPTHLLQSFYLADKGICRLTEEMPEWQSLGWKTFKDLSVVKGVIKRPTGFQRVRVTIRHDLPGNVRVETGPQDGKTYTREMNYTILELKK